MIVSIDFSDYVKDIIPSEWTVSFVASYPEYLKACSLAVKTYSWHLTVYPVSSDPYYEVHDEYNQSYWVGTYDNLDYSNQYVLDQALYAISNYVMAKSAGGGEEKVFRAEYGSGIYGQYSGTLGDVTAKAQAQAGNLYQDILRYAYDYSYNGGWGAIVFRTHV